MGIYTDNVKDMKFSYSRMTSYEGCPYAFYLNYILRDFEAYPRLNNYYAENGSCAHETFEAVLNDEIPIEEAASKYYELYKGITSKTKDSIMESTFNATFDTFCNLNEDWIDSKYEIVGVELELETNIGDVKFFGYLDVLLRDKTDGKLVIMDHKSCKPFFRKDGKVYAGLLHQFEEYKRQAYLYAKLVYDNYGEFPKAFLWNHFKSNCVQSYVEFNESEYEETLKWFLDMFYTICEDEEFQPKQYLLDSNVKSDEFYCNNLCGFRKCCEYFKEYRKKYWKRR